MTEPKPENYYIDNDEFYKQILKYKLILEKDPLAPFPEYLGECFLQIANNLAFRPNFIGYTYKQDMIGDGIENCLRYWDRFSPEKSQNPFAYFSQICWWAFVRRIQTEKKQNDLKMELYESDELFSDMTETQSVDFRTYSNQKMIHAQNEFQKDRERKKKPKKKKLPFGLEIFLV
jgi:hypothetical protein